MTDLEKSIGVPNKLIYILSSIILCLIFPKWVMSGFLKAARWQHDEKSISQFVIQSISSKADTRDQLRLSALERCLPSREMK